MIRFAVEGDLRFLSHHDLMRAVERVAARAALPLRYSQGFNPRPVLSLICPRPVGVTTRDDVLVASLESPVAAEELAARLNSQAPKGMKFLHAEPIAPGAAPRLRQVAYELPLAAEAYLKTQRRLDELKPVEAWTVQRVGPPQARPDRPERRTLDLRLFVAELTLTEAGGDAAGLAVLHVKLVPQGDGWARPVEVLRLLGLDEHMDLSRMTRTEVTYV
jgi:radical SAM-linked protein